MSTVAFSIFLVSVLIIILFIWGLSMRKKNKNLTALLLFNCLILLAIAIGLVIIGRNMAPSTDWRFTTFLQLILLVPLIAIPGLFIRQSRKKLSDILLVSAGIILIIYLLGLGVLLFNHATTAFF